MDIRNKDKILEILQESHDCGPFNGGCLMFADALQKKYGGELCVLYSKKYAEHAVLLLDDMLHDFAYSVEPSIFIELFDQDWPLGYQTIGNLVISEFTTKYNNIYFT